MERAKATLASHKINRAAAGVAAFGAS